MSNAQGMFEKFIFKKNQKKILSMQSGILK